jgi:tetratricopeptide (TPR) repeat protein
MFQNYVESARRTIFFARHEAAELGFPDILPEHILLGLLKSDSGVIANDVSAREIRREILSYLSAHEKQSHRGDMSFSKQSREVLAAAEAEAEGVAHSFVTNYHIVLGLMHVENCFAALVLGRKGLSAKYLRMQRPASDKENRMVEPARDVSDVLATQSPSERKLLELEKRLIELVRLDDYEGALKLVDDATAEPSLDRNGIMGSLIPVASVVARIIGDLDLARRYCEQRVASDPGNAMALYELADCLALQGKSAEANKVARQSYALSLAQGTAQGQSLAELIEHRFPKIKARG